MDKYTGKRLDGRYEIQELIGVGGMAMVYKAHDNLDDKTVAIKILKDEFLGNEEFIRRFKNESKAIAVLSHPNIVKVYDVSFGDRIQYIVMEYIDGITLKEYIGQQDVIPWKEAVHFTVQILQALQHAHEKGIVHRDVKPQNIMLLQDGTIKVTDFGIARFSNNETRTMTDKAIGSVHYIAPEQARGGVTDGKADIYSVGVMLYEMLTGKLPFDADSAVSVAIMQLQAEPKPLREINENVPEGLEEITLRAMRKEPRQRYQSAREMLDAIEMFRRDPSIHFAYNYFEDGSPTKYVEKIGAAPVAKPKDPPAYESQTYHPEEETVSNRSGAVVKWLTVLISVLVLTALIVFFVLLFQNLNKNNEKKIEDVPNFVGMSYSEAMEKYGNTYKLTIKHVNKDTNTDYVIDENTPIDTVVGQSVQAGSKKVREQTPIELVVYTNKKPITVPKVKNYTEEEALDKIKNKGFTADVDVQRVYQSNIPEGKVVDCTPQEGTEQYPDTTITLIVSAGNAPEYVEIPSVEGLTFENAKANLEILKFKTERQTVASALDAGIVVGTDPLPGNRLEEKRKVTILVSDGSLVRKAMNYTVPLPEEEYAEIAVKVIRNEPNGTNVVLFDQSVIPGEGTSVNVTLDPKDAINDEIKITVMVDGAKWESVVFNFETQTYQQADGDYKLNYKIKQPGLMDEKVAAYNTVVEYADSMDYSSITSADYRKRAKEDIKSTQDYYGKYDTKKKVYSGVLFEAKTIKDIEELIEQAKKDMDEVIDSYAAVEESSTEESSDEESSDEESSDDESSDEESSDEESSDEESSDEEESEDEPENTED